MNKVNWADREASLKYHREFNKVWYQKNKKKRSQQIKDYGLVHRADSVRRTQKYVAKNKDRVYAYGKEYNKTVRGGFRSYKSVATKKGNEFLLTPEDFAGIVGQCCKYCGEDSQRIGIDRIDNTKGYTIENSAPCCKTCNYMKKNHTIKDFLDHVMKIAQYNKISL